MTLDERILDFMDGSLPADDEAELLHTLSVSPEKRSVLRGFMEQRTLLTRDSKAIQATLAAEERLWQRLDAVMPAATPADPALIPVPVESNAGTLANSFRMARPGVRAFASAMTLFAGIGIGYFAGAHHAPVHTRIVEVHAPAPAVSPALADAGSNAPVYQKIVRRYILSPVRSAAMLPAIPVLPALVQNPPVPNAAVPNGATPDLAANLPAEPSIASVAPQRVPPLAERIGGGGGITPVFHHISTFREPARSFLQRFELRVDESFGRQFPNNAATSASWPLITNSSISAFFQVLPHSNLLWVGGGYGSASVTTKELSVEQGDPGSQYIPLSQDVLVADTVHKQTNYFSAMAELRLPAFPSTDLTLGGGYGWANLGRMLIGELGFHYNISQQVGTEFGLRVMRFTYDLSAEKQAVVQAAQGGLAISNAAVATGPSFNTELNAGLFFDF